MERRGSRLSRRQFVVGAGGIGQELKNSMDLLDFPRLLTIITIILVMVTLIDHGSQWVRRRLE